MAKNKIGLQLSVGGLGDKSFNDSAFAGLQRAQELYDVHIEIADWHGAMRDTEAMEEWAKKGYDLIIAIGYTNAAALNAVAIQYPDNRFAIVDVEGIGGNIWSAIYREYEGDFVVGALAGLATETNMVGFMGGGITPVIRRIESGFAQGVQHIGPSISFVSDYVGAFDDEEKGRILAETQYSMGVDVIYQVAGRCGLGAIEAAKAFDKYIISTGGDHTSLAPAAVLTSRIKDVGKPIVDVVGDLVRGKFEGGVKKSYGFEEGGLRLASIQPHVEHIVTPHYQEVMRDILSQVITGEIQVKIDI